MSVNQDTNKSMSDWLHHHWLKAVIAFGVVVLAIVVFYQGVLIPNAREARLLQEQLNRSEQESRDRLNAETKALAAKDEREACLKNADDLYDFNWSKACQNLKDARDKKYSTCMGTDPNPPSWGHSYCVNQSGGDPKEPFNPECTLPTLQAENINQYRTEAKEECFMKFPVAAN